jgi:hypothetical protein
MNEIVSLFKEGNTGDMMGLGSICNTFADLLSPATGWEKEGL